MAAKTAVLATVAVAFLAVMSLPAGVSALGPFVGYLTALGPVGDVYITVQASSAVYTHKIWYQVQNKLIPKTFGPKIYITGDSGQFITNKDNGFTKNLGKFNPSLNPLVAEVIFGIDVYETADISGTPKWVWQTGGPNAGTNDGVAHAKFDYVGTDIVVTFEDRPNNLPDRPEASTAPKDYNDCVFQLRGVAAVPL